MKIKIPTGKAFAALKALGADAIDQIDKRLLDGQPGRVVADWLQNDVQVMLHVKPESLKKTLERYRDTELRKKVTDRIGAATNGQSPRSILQRLNAMDELESLAQIQTGRVHKLLGKEADMAAGLVLKSIAPEMKLLKDTLVDLGKLQLETGVLQRASKTFKGTVTDEDGETRTFEWTEEQERLYAELTGVEDRERARA